MTHLDTQTSPLDFTPPPAPTELERVASGEVEAPSGALPSDDTTTNPDDLWTRRAGLQHLRRFAQSRNVNPWGMLGCVLARVVASTPPTLVTPPLIGGDGSLNTFIALVANSGGGKGAVMQAARDAVAVTSTGGFPVDVPEFPGGTGEGLVRRYVPPPPPKKDEQPRPTITRALVNESEVSNLEALGGRQGATLVPTLLKMWSGEQAGFTNSSEETTTNIEAHTYRLAMITQVQPSNAPAILKYEGSGLPQRYVWLPAWIEDGTEWVNEDVDPLQVQVPNQHERTVMTLPDSVAHYVVADYHARGARSFDVDADPLEGHRNMLQIKLACGMALLDGRATVNLEDWELARLVMVKHMDTLGLVRSQLAAKANREAQRRGERERAAKLEQQERLEQRARDHVVRHLERSEGTANMAACRYGAKGDIRKLVPDVFEVLEAEGLIQVSDEGTKAVAAVVGPEGLDRVREWSNRSN